MAARESYRSPQLSQAASEAERGAYISDHLMTAERTYTDREVALILRRATEMQHDGSARTEGLSLSALRDIAREIGLDPDLVSEAARQLPAAEAGALARFFGGGTQYEIHLAHDAPLAPEQLQDLAMTIRSAMRHQGQTQEVMGSLEWKTTGEVSQVAVTASTHGGRTSVHVIADRGGAAFLTGVGSIGLGVFAAAVTGAIIEPGVAGGVALMGGGVAGGVALARAIWRRNTRKFREKLARLTEGIRRTFEG